MIADCRLPREYQHHCGGTCRPTQVHYNDIAYSPYLAFESWDADTFFSYDDPHIPRYRQSPEHRPIVWKQTYECDRCHALVKLTEPLRTVIATPARTITAKPRKAA